MSEDEYRAVYPHEHMLEVYPCGVRAGEMLQLKRDIPVRDHEDLPTGRVLRSGSRWKVLLGLPREPDVVWLEGPMGRPHTWDDSKLLEDFDRVT